jgi:tetratricopeptide (TPR) repeat protein
MARIITRKNVGVTALANESTTLKNQINSDRGRLATVRAGAAGAAERDAINATIARNTVKADSLDAVVAVMNKEIDRGFEFYFKYLETRPDDRLLLQEITAAYSQFRNYVGVAKTLSLTLGSLPESNEEFMAVGRAYYNGRSYQSADSIFNVIIRTSPNYVPAHLYIARTSSRLDPDAKAGLAKPKFDQLVTVTQRDSVTYKAELSEALQFLCYYYMSSENYTQARAYYNRLAEVDPNNNDNKIRAYSGIGMIEMRLVGTATTNEGRLPFLSRSREAYNRVIAIDPNNASARAQLNYISEYEASIRRGINPNEIRGTVTDAATGAPIPFASIRVKDTAAENLTNQRGEFRFEIPAGMEILIISARDYRAVEVPITASRQYNVTLSK